MVLHAQIQVLSLPEANTLKLLFLTMFIVGSIDNIGQNDNFFGLYYLKCQAMDTFFYLGWT